jgi:HEAT repeat protein
MGDPVYTLIQQARHAEPAVRKQSAVELGKSDLSSHRQDAIRALCDLLSHEHLEVREAAKEALISIGGDDVVEALVSYLTNSSTTALNYAIEILSQKGSDGIDHILALLASKNHDVRKFGCDILGNLRYSDSVYDLIELLSDPHINVAIAAGEALGKLRNPEAVPHLIRALQHPDTWMRCIAAEALGKIGDPRALDAFLAVPSDEEPIVVYTAIKAMSRLRDKQVVPYMLSILRSNSMFAPSVAQAIEHLAADQGEAIYHQVKTSGVTTPFVCLLSSEHVDVLRSAIHLVKNLQLREAIQALRQLLHHADDEVVAEAIEALVRLEDPGTITPVFQQLLTQTSNRDRKHLFQQALSLLQKEQGAR